MHMLLSSILHTHTHQPQNTHIHTNSYGYVYINTYKYYFNYYGKRNVTVTKRETNK